MTSHSDGKEVLITLLERLRDDAGNPLCDAALKVVDDPNRVTSNVGVIWNDLKTVGGAWAISLFQPTPEILDNANEIGVVITMSDVMDRIISTWSQGFCAGIEYQRERAQQK